MWLAIFFLVIIKLVDILFKMQKNRKNIDSKLLKTKNSRLMLLSNALYVDVKNQDL